MTAPSSGPRRAIWGLVNDGYALVAKTATLSHDDAFELCRVPDIGDPSAYLDQGVAYLRAPKWGHVFARYYTNAERDSAGRASLVYDVVALSDSDFATLGNDPFQALPALPDDRRPERFGELPPLSLTVRGNQAEAARLAALLEREDHATLTTLLGAVLAGAHVLCIAPGLRTETIECLVLLLPPALRPVLTFQTPTVDFPKHTPRLTVAERSHALLVEREWSVVLPRDADDPRLAEAKATAARLLALGRTPERSRRAWGGLGSQGPDTASVAMTTASGLHDTVAAMLRFDVLEEALRVGDLRRAVLVVPRADSAAERLALTEAIFARHPADRVAGATVDVVRGEQRDAWRAVQAVAGSVAEHRSQSPDQFATFFRAVIDGLQGVPRPDRDPTARDVQVLLACAAASLDDLERFLDVADPTLPWENAWRDGSARWVKGRSPVARLFDALAARGATYAEASDGLNAVVSVTTSATGPARDKAASIALVLVRRTMRERGALEPPDRLGALVDGLMRVWSAESHPAPSAFRSFLGSGADAVASTDPRRLAADLSRTIAEIPDAASETELLGWAVAALDRARANAAGDVTVRAVASLLEEQRRLSPRSEMAAHVGRVLLHFATADAAFVFRPAWLEVARQVDDASRHELLTRALGWVARGYAQGRYTLGALADACVVSGAEGGVVDDRVVDLLVPHLATVAGTQRSASELAVLSAAVSAVATPAAAERLTEALLGAVGPETADAIRMRRLALALHEIERVRGEDRYNHARAVLRRVLARGEIGAQEEHALREFLGVEDGSMIGRLFARVPGLTSGTAAVAEERR